MRSTTLASLALFVGLTTTAAVAAPTTRLDPGVSTSAVEQAQGWRYHRNCGWRGGRWVADLGGGRVVVCRPNRPGRDWRWHSEGNRHGWYHERRRTWHNHRW